MNAIRKIHVTSIDIIETENGGSKFGLSHLKNLIIGSTPLDTLRFSGVYRKEFPLITILNFLASLQTHPDGMLPDTQHNQIRVLKLREISCFEDCSNISPIGLAGLEILHISWGRWSDTRKRKFSVTACEDLAKMIKATRYWVSGAKPII
ncbi:hypothetical protein K435DRAFT_324865 [Dendrothele bispora CBS 962.96]|uniref:Uncharacterized protein n=1 Tax=Dendrothele bispora (strain CBS 962.96) TaxID=1314807 RepID=A0A4S8KJ25_DENBC|nr:hypothetical protein K435DRAFT_324865 [Dendrothele bispora CBS 962.96]